MAKIDFFFFHGRPGSGKGTQLDQLRADTPRSGIVYPGEIIRRARNPHDPQYVRYHADIAPYIAATEAGGIAVPPDTVGKIVEQEVERHLCEGEETILFDGFPRGKRYLSQKERPIAAARRRGHRVRERHVLLDVPEEVARQRLQEAQRDRPDDAAIDRRMAEFDSETQPMIDELERRGLLRRVDGVGTVDEVRERVRRAIRK